MRVELKAIRPGCWRIGESGLYIQRFGASYWIVDRKGSLKSKTSYPTIDAAKQAYAKLPNNP